MMIFSRLAHKYDLEQARKEARKEAAEEAAAAVAAAQKEAAAAVAVAQKEAAAAVAVAQKEAAVAVAQKEAAQRERQQWLDWNARRELAAERGEPFNEPLPGSQNGPVG